MSSLKNKYFPYIDSLRALAVVSVIIYHLNGSWLPGGFAGVDVFFVISGFVVTTSLLGYPKEKGLLYFFPWFYARRLQRILPALIVCLLVTSLCSAAFIPSSWLSEANSQTGQRAFLGLSNFVLAETQNDYFSPRVEFNPYTHTWSLGVEEQFYFIFPFLMLLWVLGRVWRLASIVLIVATVVFSIGAAWWLSKNNPTLGFYMIISRFWELGLGAVLAIFFFRRDASLNSQGIKYNLSRLGFILSLILIFIGFFSSNPSTFPFPGAFLPVLGTLGIIASLHGKVLNSDFNKIFVHPILIYIGKISYSLYLWHWPIFVLFRWTVGLESPSQQLSAVFLTILMSNVSYYLVEKPLRYSATLQKMPKPIVVIFGLSIVFSAWWSAGLITRNENFISRSTVTHNAQDWYPAGDISAVQENTCDLSPSWQNFNGASVLQYHPANCKLGAQSSHRLFVIGDSHAAAYDPMMRAFVKRTGVEVFYYNNGGCPFISFNATRDIQNPGCVQNIQISIADMLGRAKEGDVLFMAGLRMPRFVDQFMRFDKTHAQSELFGPQPEQWRADSEAYAVNLLQKFSEKGVKVIIEAPKPVFRQVPYRCSDWFNKSNPICVDPSVEDTSSVSRDEMERMRAPVLASIKNIEHAVKNVYIWDPLPLLCTSQRCQTARDGKPLFFDGDHISGYANMYLLPAFTERFEQVLAL
ncbi:acyltransferase family protein [Pseudomonas luteola]|uniref:acyltransferase family protein n=1 Tax=Pseudomonas luteola TaxID=47886 RepID=UPI003A86F976